MPKTSPTSITIRREIDEMARHAVEWLGSARNCWPKRASRCVLGFHDDYGSHRCRDRDAAGSARVPCSFWKNLGPATAHSTSWGSVHNLGTAVSQDRV